MNTDTAEANRTHDDTSAGPRTYTPGPRPAGLQQLTRPVHDRMLAGVASGVARYLDIDATIVRIVFAVLVVVGGAGIPLYVAGWLLMPDEGTGQSIAGEYLSSRQARS
jgi:phage shock protein C